MKKPDFRLLLALVPIALVGCAETTPHYDEHFGEAVRSAVAQQTINPNAASNPDPVAGLDGKAADQTINNYDKSFEAPEKVQTLSITVGGTQ
jgi:type IV pilus biogenesis protein CpaD/CtpE